MDMKNEGMGMTKMLTAAVVGLIAAISTAPAPGESGTLQSGGEGTVVLFGDSTTAPRGSLKIFGNLIADDLAKRGLAVSVINAGVGGNTTAAARKRFESDVLARNPDVVTILFGINDAAVDVWKGATTPRVSLDTYRGNLTYFVKTLKARGARPILLTPNSLEWTPKLRELYGKPPYDPSSDDGFNVLLDQYAEAVRTIAENEQVPLVDVRRIFKQHRQRNPDQPLLLDGMHPNALGHRLIADALLKVIMPVLKDD